MSTVAILGSGTISSEAEDYQNAYQIATKLGQIGLTIMTGGYGGIMEAASKGGYDAGVNVIGVTTEKRQPLQPNVWLKQNIHYPTVDERLRHLVEQADGYVVMQGRTGTYFEVHEIITRLATGAMSAKPIVLWTDYWISTIQSLKNKKNFDNSVDAHIHIVNSVDEVIKATRSLAC